jgi:PAS domain S-box-containing protein
MAILCAEVTDRKDTMHRSGKNGERGERVRKDKRRSAKLEPLRPQVKQPDILRDEMAKFSSENPYPVLRIHKDGTVLYANKASEPLLKALESDIGQPAPSEWHRLVKKTLSSGQVIREETKHEGRVFAFRAVPIAENDYVNFYGVDITEQKRAEDALRETTQTLEAVIQASPLPIFAVDRERIVKMWNPAAERTFGWSAQEVIGRQYPAIPKEKMDEADALFSRALESGLTEVETLRQRKDGSLMDVGISAAPLRDSRGNINGVMAVLTDITKRKRAELALRTSEEQHRTILQTTMDGFWLSDMQGRLLEVNDAYCQISGYSREELLKMSIAQLEAVETPEGVLQHIQKIVTHGADRFETLHHRKDRSVFQVEVSVHFLPTEAGRLFCFLRDITVHKSAVERLLKYQKHLKRLAAQLTLAEEQERRRIAGELHDHVNQSLALAKIKLDTLHAAVSSQPLAQALEDISGSMEKAIQDTRSLTFDLSSPILYELGFEAAVAEWLDGQVRDKHGIATEFEDDGQSKPLDDDVRVLLFRNVRELLINCIKHAHADKVVVRIRRIDGSIEVVVEDNGIGFDPTEVKSMAARRSEFGLLSIRERLEELGGRFEIESKPGAGCKATMTAPLKGESRKKEE